MKKLILAAVAVTCAVSVFAQGTINFNNRTAAGFARVWGPATTDATLSLQGNAPTVDTPAGTVDYAGVGCTLLSGSTYFAALIGAPGSGVAEASLVPQGAATTFRTGTGAGFIASTTVTLTTIAKDAPVATFELVAWDNASGQYSTWALAEAAWKAGTIAAGKSLPFEVLLIGGDVNNPPNLTGLTGFNIYTISTIPEPSSMALAGLGAAALMIFRRRK